MKKARKGEKNGREKEGYEETVEKLKKVRKGEELGRKTRRKNESKERRLNNIKSNNNNKTKIITQSEADR